MVSRILMKVNNDDTVEGNKTECDLDQRGKKAKNTT